MEFFAAPRSALIISRKREISLCVVMLVLAQFIVGQGAHHFGLFRRKSGQTPDSAIGCTHNAAHNQNKFQGIRDHHGFTMEQALTCLLRFAKWRTLCA
jgi:hypothetical protein